MRPIRPNRAVADHRIGPFANAIKASSAPSTIVRQQAVVDRGGCKLNLNSAAMSVVKDIVPNPAEKRQAIQE